MLPERAAGAALSLGVFTPLVWMGLAWGQGSDAAASAMPPDVAVGVELVRLLGAPGLALAMGWGLARWRPQITIVVKHELPEDSCLQVALLEADLDEEASRPRVIPRRRRGGGSDVE